MATTTPNFGWDVPQSTDLVKDGATAIAALGNDIDTSLVDLKGGTTGQVLSKASNTDMDFTWVAQDDSNAIQNAIVDAKGDLISATAADTPARLAVGTDGQVLTADSSQSTGLKWATPTTGLTFTHRYATTADLYAIAYNGSNLYVAVGNTGNLITSSDALTWTSRTSGFGTNAIRDVAFGNGLFVAVGANGTLTTSSDGITWTARTSNMGTNQINSVLYANSLWVAVGDGGGTTNTGGIIYSTDGITWTRKSQSLTVGANYRTLSWNGTNWVAGGSVSTNNYLYASTPSGTWTAGDTGSAQQIYKILWDGTRHITYEGSSVPARYSTSLTLGATTAMSYGPFASIPNTWANAYYYNGKVYVGNAVWNQSFTSATTTTPILQQPFTVALSGSTSPYLQENSTGIWVGSIGIIVMARGIWTSF